MEQTKGWDKDCRGYKCSDGVHLSWWQAIVGTDEWKSWDKYNRGKNMKYDIPEVAECGWMSEQHAKDFFAFIKSDAKRRGHDKRQQDGYAFWGQDMDRMLRQQIADAESEAVDLCKRHYNDKVKEAHRVVLKEVLEIIEAKLKNDPNNPVLVMGLRYVEGIIKEKLAQ